MTEVFPNIFVGSQKDYAIRVAFNNEKIFYDEFSFIGAAKHPWHKQFARMDGSTVDGYDGKTMPKDQKEYLYAKREHSLYCNLIDCGKHEYIPDEIINACHEFMKDELGKGRKILICCNHGESMAPAISLMYLIGIGEYDDCKNIEDVVKKFMGVYPDYAPQNGIKTKLEEFWRLHNEKKDLR